MKFSKLERLAEINNKLAPTLEWLGVKARLSQEDGELAVRFENGDGTLYSPVWLEFPKTRNPMSSWRDVDLPISDIRSFQIGDNGWVYYHDSGNIGGMTYDGDLDEFFAIMREELEDRGVIKDWAICEQQSFDVHFARSFQQLQKQLGPSVAITCERTGDVESYRFEDRNARTCKVAFEGDLAVLYVDGNRQGALPKDGDDCMARLLGGGFCNLPDLATGGSSQESLGSPVRI